MDPLAVITTGTGYFRPGLPARIVGGGERRVFLGPPGQETPHTLPEFTLQFPAGNRREGCQYGRDFVFATTQPAPP